jgi:hypothetical protein
MGRFFFHVKTPDKLQRDQIGVDFESTEEAFLNAHEAIPGLAADLLQEGIDPMACEIIVEDEKQQQLFVLPFSEYLSRNVRD